MTTITTVVALVPEEGTGQRVRLNAYMSCGEESDQRLPVVTAFDPVTPSDGTTIELMNFVGHATLGSQINGYLVTNDWIQPAEDDLRWLEESPDTFVSNTAGEIRMYAWVRDTMGRVSLPFTRQGYVDVVIPIVSAFVLPEEVTTIPIPVLEFEAWDDNQPVDYLITQSDRQPNVNDPGWSNEPPTEYYPEGNPGNLTFYAWVKDLVHNISYPFIVTRYVDTESPVVTDFQLEATSSDFYISVLNFTATDDVSVTGYKITETEMLPSVSALGWTPTPPLAFITEQTGAITLYAWAKDASGKVSHYLSAKTIVEGS